MEQAVGSFSDPRAAESPWEIACYAADLARVFGVFTDKLDPQRLRDVIPRSSSRMRN